MPLDGLGQRFLQARLWMGATRGKPVSQREAGRAIGMTGAAIGAYEAGTNEPGLETIEQLAVFYGVRRCWLALEDGPMLEIQPAPGGSDA